VLCLGVLGIFKYANFGIGVCNRLLAAVHLDELPWTSRLILPVGISFYTIQAIGYLIDVYRREVYAEKNFLRFFLFLAFFPQLVAGPIERSKNLLRQLGTRQYFSYENLQKGLLLGLWGMFVKVVIADRAAIFVDNVYGDYNTYGGWYIVIATMLFAIQIYCDFYGYSTIARGCALTFGYTLVDNFNAPYFSGSIKEFWRRWHISLSSWLRDYVYIPLGGNRCSKPRKYFNIMVTFLVSGVWHGASLHYVFWGALQGIFIVIGDMTRPLKQRLNQKYAVRTNSAGYHAGQTFMTYLLFLISFTFFRAESISDGVYYLERIVRRFDAWSLLSGYVYTLGLDGWDMLVLVLGVIILLAVDWAYQKRRIFFDALVREQCLAVQYLIVVVLFVTILVCGVYGEGYDGSQFIYFQF